MTKNPKELVGHAHDVSTLVRPTFGPGMLLQHDDLEHVTDYTRELSRLLFRSFFGCGVVCGLVVTTKASNCGKVTIGVDAGLALDCAGDPVYVPKHKDVVFGDCKDETVTTLWVLLCGTTKSCNPRTSTCGCDDDDTRMVPTRLRSAFEIRVVNELPACICRCPDPEIPSQDQATTGQVALVSGTPASAATGQPAQSKAGQVIAKEPDPYGCVDCTSPCYASHYKGECGTCEGGGKGGDACTGCGSCDCILLARLDFDTKKKMWDADHRVRRFIRPVLMRDPQMARDERRRRDKADVVRYNPL